MPRICIVEDRRHPSPGTLALRLTEIEGFTLRTADAVPSELDTAEVLVLNNITNEQDSIPEDRILRFVDDGGGALAVHDSVFPYAFNRAFVSACGIRNATGAMQFVIGPGGQSMQINLARSDPADPMTRFPVKPLPDGAGHPNS
jgi:hypothetical protein